MTADEALKKSKEELDSIGRHLYTTEAGQSLLKLLEEMFYKGPLVGKTPEETYFNLGRREVVEFLHGLAPKEK